MSEHKIINGEVDTFDIRGDVEYMQPQEIVFYNAQPQAREVTRAEADAILNAVIEQYAADHKVNYVDAVTAMQKEAPELLKFWQNTK